MIVMHMLSIYESASQLNDAVEEDDKRHRATGLSKESGFCLIEPRCGSCVGCRRRSHPRIEEVNTITLCEMSNKFESIGYAPEKKLTLFDIDDEEEFPISHPSENLSVAFGLSKTVWL
ncbi:hypothetical protein NE237_002086 [Protea cynaroides]|uniref:Uncharacterized protein n=1 Tax=Protea cynaroides TaxID=273540 RepID=A0A9Q0QZ44_9MAGN|nr:hypothetical protein NE237_002086 [Protea cynaroides]